MPTAKSSSHGIAQADLARLDTTSIDALLDSAKATLHPLRFRRRRRGTTPGIWCWPIRRNWWPISSAAGRSGIEGTVEQPAALRGGHNDVYVAPGVKVHPMVVLDAEHGPILHRRRGRDSPLHAHRRAVLHRTEVDPAGRQVPRRELDRPDVPHRRRGRGVDHSRPFQQVSRRLPRSRLTWASGVNLGALTTNSDLKNDYTNVSVSLDGHGSIDTGSTKVGALIGDHTKTSIGTRSSTPGPASGRWP